MVRKRTENWPELISNAYQPTFPISCPWLSICNLNIINGANSFSRTYCSCKIRLKFEKSEVDLIVLHHITTRTRARKAKISIYDQKLITQFGVRNLFILTTITRTNCLEREKTKNRAIIWLDCSGSIARTYFVFLSVIIKKNSAEIRNI